MSKANPQQRGHGKAHGRTCVGCGEKDSPAAFVRLVLVEDGSDTSRVLVDVGNSSFGRGAHVHARRSCLEKACKGGLSRSFKTRVVANAADLGSDIAAGMDRRFEGLLLAGRRSGYLVLGADAVCELLEQRKDLVIVVARDTKTVVSRRPIAEAIAEGRAMAWGTKEGVGRLLGREEVALVAVTSASIASELRAVFAQGDACRFSGDESEGRAVAGLGRGSAAVSEGR